MHEHEQGVKSSIVSRLWDYISSRHSILKPPTQAETGSGSALGAQMINDLLESGAINDEELNAYYNNLFTGDLDFQRNLELLDKQQAFNSAEAEKNRQWQTAMSNTAISRQMSDLKSSGFNPALALGGSGASVMSVNTPSTSSSYGGISPSVANLFSTAITASTSQNASNNNLLGNLFSSVTGLIGDLLKVINK